MTIEFTFVMFSGELLQLLGTSKAKLYVTDLRMKKMELTSVTSWRDHV